jgi:hypothetical protein
LDDKIILSNICEHAVDFRQLERIWELLQKNSQEKEIDPHYIIQHIEPKKYLESLEKFFLVEDNSYPAFEDKVLLLLNISRILRDSAYSKSLDDKLKLLIQRNYEFKTWRFDPLYAILIQIEGNEELLSIKEQFFEDLLKSTKSAILNSQPTYIDDFKRIKNYIQDLGLFFNNDEMNELETRLGSILSEGIKIDKDFTIFTYNPDEDCFDSVGFKIGGLEELRDDLEEISSVFRSFVKEAQDDIENEIDAYYNSLNPPENDEEINSNVSTNLEDEKLNDENEIDCMFDSLRNR